MGRKRLIGVFAGQAEMPAQKELIQGIAREALKNNINVAVFSTIIQSGGTELFSEGEALVYDIANLDKLDAIIIMPETLHITEGLLEKLCERIRTHTKLIKLSYDREIDGFVPFLCDDVRASKEIVNHLIKKHGCRDIAYMTGKEGHPHSLARLEGYRQALEENNIPYDPEMVFFGDFWYNEGERVVNELLKTRKRIPDAIACANEPMAISVCEALEKQGISIPDQISVVGFDHSGDGIFNHDVVTSITRETELIGHEMVNYVISQLEGISKLEPVEKKVSPIFIGETCGCAKSDNKIDTSLIYKTDDKNYFSMYNFITETIMGAKTIQECLQYVEDSSKIWLLEHKTLYFIQTEKSYTMKGESFPRDNFLGNERMINVLKTDYNDDNQQDKLDFKRYFDKGDMLPDLWAEDREAQIYYFNISHFNSEVFGYSVVSFDKEPFANDTNFAFWIKDLNTSFESLRRLYYVNFLYHDAERKSITDSMSGLYNRNGFNRMITEKIADMSDDDYMLLMEFDNNNLKTVNDKYGHEAGDEMILLSTQAIDKSRVAGASYEANFRIGGDEYVKLAIGSINEASAEQAKREEEQFLENVTYVLDRPYPITLACGYNILKKSEIKSVDEIMKVADQRMYEHKAAIKKSWEEESDETDDRF